MMETARVDIRKLQLLNDRINQCLDALNQVRLTVHGLAHSTAPGLGAGNAGSIGGLGQIDPRFAAGDPRFTAIDPRFAGGGQQAAYFGGYPQGLSHSTFGPQMAFGAQGSLGQAQNPYAIPNWGAQGGLSHSGAELDSIYNRPVWADPTMANKVKETFPFVGYALPPIVALF